MPKNQSINGTSLNCPSCRAANQINASFCSNCGTSLTNREQPYQPPASRQVPPLSVEFVYAGFWKRFFAYWIDGIIFGFSFVVLAVIAFKVPSYGDDLSQVGLFYIIFYAGWWMYFALQESSSAQATLGKRALGIKVADMNGYPLSFMHAAGRQLSGVISSFTFTIGYLLAAFSGRKQALHDMIAGTVVVNKNFGPNQILQANQSPPPGMSPMAIIGIVFLVLIVPVGGIIAAVAIPAYNQYRIKALVSDGYEHASSAKHAIIEHASETGYWPVNFEQVGLVSEDMRNENYYIQLQKNGVLDIHFAQPQPISGSLLRLTPDISTNGNYVWQCQSNKMEATYVPANCE